MSSATEKALIIKLNNLLSKGEKHKIIEWLEMLKIYNSIDGKIPHLFGNSKIKIITESETGTYNVILVWLKNNARHFEDSHFIDVPDSNYTSISEIRSIISNVNSPAAFGRITASNQKTFKNKQDVERWKDDPTIHPITGVIMNTVSTKYAETYSRAYKILKKSYIRNDDMEELLPNNHVLFGNINLLFYQEANKSFNNTTKTCEILSFNVDLTEQKDTILDTEIELLKNIVNIVKVDMIIRGIKVRISNFEKIKKYFEDHIKNMILKLFNPTFNYNIDTIYNIINHDDIDNINEFIIFIENNKLGNGMKIIDYIKQNETGIGWKVTFLELYDRYKKLYDDIDKLLDKNSGIIENYNNKLFTHIEDPIDKYFIEFEKELEKIKDPKFSKLIDLTTFEPVNISIFLNDEQLKVFNIEYDKKEIEYEENKIEYDKQRKQKNTSKSPEPPKRPTIKYGKNNKLVYTYGNKKPVHISNKLLEEFNSEYKSLKGTIVEYNKIKNMSYKELVKYGTKKSLSTPIKAIIEENELFQMNRQQINDTILNDYSDLEDKCNNRIDILTTNELDDENYPLAKLQLMVRLKMNKRTECIYAPALYNYFVNCVNNKTPFKNPITNQKYTDEHIKQLMDIIRIVNINIEIPKYLKPINDTKLIIDYRSLISVDIEGYKGDENFTGWDRISEINFYEINIYRQFGDQNYIIYKVCTIPANMEPTGVFATDSNDLTSSTMLFKIIKLFNDGRLLCNYLPPYYNIINNQYIDLGIHFNRYKTVSPWLFDNADGKFLSKTKFINLFKHYAEEINNYM